MQSNNRTVCDCSSWFGLTVNTQLWRELREHDLVPPRPLQQTSMYPGQRRNPQPRHSPCSVSTNFRFQPGAICKLPPARLDVRLRVCPRSLRALPGLTELPASLGWAPHQVCQTAGSPPRHLSHELRGKCTSLAHQPTALHALGLPWLRHLRHMLAHVSLSASFLFTLIPWTRYDKMYQLGQPTSAISAFSRSKRPWASWLMQHVSTVTNLGWFRRASFNTKFPMQLQAESTSTSLFLPPPLVLAHLSGMQLLLLP